VEVRHLQGVLRDGQNGKTDSYSLYAELVQTARIVVGYPTTLRTLSFIDLGLSKRWSILTVEEIRFEPSFRRVL